MSVNNRLHKSSTQHAIYQSQHLNDIRKDVKEIKEGIIGDDNDLDVILGKHPEIKKISNHAHIKMLRASDMSSYGGGVDNANFSLIDPIPGQSRTHFVSDTSVNNGISDYSAYQLRVKSTSASDAGKTIFLKGIRDPGAVNGETQEVELNLTFGADSSVFHNFPTGSIQFINEMRVDRLNNTLPVPDLEGEIMLESTSDVSRFVKTITADHHSGVGSYKYSQSSINEFHVASTKRMVVNDIHLDYNCDDDVVFIFNIGSFHRGSGAGLNEAQFTIFKKIVHLEGRENKVVKIDKVIEGGEFYQLFVVKTTSSEHQNNIHCCVNGFLVDR